MSVTIKPPLPYHKDPRRVVTTNDVDWGWIRSLEGGQLLKAYVPPVAKSGVTVASGVDVGQITDPTYLGRIGLSEGLVKKLLPHIGKRRDDAELSLLTHPLVLTKEEADELDAAMFKVSINYTARIYCSSNVVKEANAIADWLDLPADARTVCASLAWNIGCNLSSAAPRFFGFFLRNQWKLCQRELYNFYGSSVAKGLRDRRAKEAHRLKSLTGGDFKDPVTEMISPLCHTYAKRTRGGYCPKNRYAG